MINIKNLNKKFGNKVLFNNLCLSIEGAKLTFIYGESGSGKTTLLNIIGLIEPYDSGEIIYNDKLIVTSKDKRFMRRDKIGFIFQDFGLIENETVRQNFNLLYKTKKLKDKDYQITKVLNSVGLNDFLSRPIYELSGGEQQRVAIAKIILKDPNIILADEPTASLDEENKDMVISHLRKMSNNGKTVIVVTHDKSLFSTKDCVINLDEIKNV